MLAYKELLASVLKNGQQRPDRTGTGVISYFGGRFQHDLRNGFPLLTTKKINPVQPFAEMFGFLKGATSVQEFNELGCTIWDPWGLEQEVYNLSQRDKLSSYLEYLDKTEQTSDDPEADIARDDKLAEDYVKQLQQAALDFSGNAQAFYAWQEKNPAPVLMQSLFVEHGIEMVEKTDVVEAGSLGPIYGAQWRGGVKGGFETDQIKVLIQGLKEHPYSRRHVVSAWNPDVVPAHRYKEWSRGIPSPITSSKQNIEAGIVLGKMALPPCHMLFTFHVNENEDGEKLLNLHLVMRSCDVPVGLPFNIAGYALLLKLIAKQTGMIAAKMIIDITDAHIYINQLDLAKEQLEREPFELCSLEIPDGIDIVNRDKLTKENVQRIVDNIQNYNHHPFIKYPVSV